MMDWTDRDFRFFVRQITRSTFLYTEMVTAPAILNGERERLLAFSEIEKPLALQIGGDDPRQLAECARIVEDYGYDEINLNVGCPSDRVQSGNFGACLMARPQLVAECVAAMRQSTRLPVTIKHRIGIDRDSEGRPLDRYEDLARFVETVAAAGCRRFIVHARIAVLGGLSPRENREVPPLRYDDVFRLKREFPGLTIEINGGVRDLATARALLRETDGVMIGRAAYENPWALAGADEWIAAHRETGAGGAGVNFEPPASETTRRAVLLGMIPYLESRVREGRTQHSVLRHMLGLFAGETGARAFRRYISEKAYPLTDADATINGALQLIPTEILDRPAPEFVRDQIDSERAAGLQV
jgi:tRNA-dihydrouridine synthase A